MINVYSFKPATIEVDAVSGATPGNSLTEEFIRPYTSKAAEGQNDGWKFMGWLLTGDTVANVPANIQVNADQLGKLILLAKHTVACDYSVGNAGQQSAAQYFKIYNTGVEMSGTLQKENGKVKGVTWTPESSESPVYANLHKGLTMVAQWR